MRWVGSAVGIAAVVAACGPVEVQIELGGTVVYDAYTSGPIRLMVAEEATEACDFTSCTGQTPGDTVAAVDLESPGEFTVRATVQESDSASAVELLAYALGDATEITDCEAGGALVMPARDHYDLVLELEPGMCPMRQ